MNTKRGRKETSQNSCCTVLVEAVEALKSLAASFVEGDGVDACLIICSWCRTI
jgi:hypothetical protein